jgi:hypothetical protein
MDYLSELGLRVEQCLCAIPILHRIHVQEGDPRVRDLSDGFFTDE